MVFHSRADYLIDIAGLGRLTERIIWEALENTGVPYVEWTARKEVLGDRAVLHLYVEPRYVNGIAERDIAKSFSRELQKLEKQYHHNPYNIYDSDCWHRSGGQFQTSRSHLAASRRLHQLHFPAAGRGR